MAKLQMNTSGQEILIVDDNPVNLHRLLRMLHGQGYQVRSATNGVQALAAVQLEPPDLILLDIMMPDMDGYEVCTRLKTNPESRDIPVIIVSALSETEDIIQAFSVGAVDYVTKPIRAEETLARVRTHLALRSLQQELRQTNQKLEKRNAELETRNTQLQEALDTIKSLSGIVNLCAWCHRKIKIEDEQWVSLEKYIEDHSQATFTHGICPDCLRKSLNETRELKKQRNLP
ncbi:MAG: response regulator [Chloroflexota bacterium]